VPIPRIVFLGTGEIAVPTFRWLVAHGPRPLLLVTQPDRPVGRHRVLTPPPLKPIAQAAAIPVAQPERIREPDACDEINALDPDLIVVMAYGQILPRRLLEIPRLACINLHASLLPRHRGAACIQATIDAGDTEGGMTVMHVAPKLDSGDLILARAVTLAPDETGGSLHDRLAELAPAALTEALALLEGGRLPRVPQDDQSATYVGKLERDDGILDWSWPASRLERRIRAYHPWPGTHTAWESKRLKVFPGCAVVEATGNPLPPGTLAAADASGLTVSCGEGLLRLADVQPDGTRRMSAAEFVRGHRVSPGSRFRLPPPASP
jgi:methionyl-tRNA formyltransferase